MQVPQLLLLGIMWALACGPPGCRGSDTHTVSWGLNVEAASIVIGAGDTVTWEWDQDQGILHNIVSGSNRVADGRFRSGNPTGFGSSFSWTFTADKFPNGVYHYFCEPHQAMVASITVQVTISGNETDLGVSCGPFPVPAGIPSSLRFDQECPSQLASTTCASRCPTGYKLSGVAQRTCLATGLWTAGDASCTLHDCGALPLPFNYPDGFAAPRCLSTTFGSSCQASCPSGYNLMGEDRFTCQSDGTWSGSRPSCVLKSRLSQDSAGLHVQVGGGKDVFLHADAAVVSVKGLLAEKTDVEQRFVKMQNDADTRFGQQAVTLSQLSTSIGQNTERVQALQGLGCALTVCDVHAEVLLGGIALTQEERRATVAEGQLGSQLLVLAGDFNDLAASLAELTGKHFNLTESHDNQAKLAAQLEAVVSIETERARLVEEANSVAIRKNSDDIGQLRTAMTENKNALKDVDTQLAALSTALSTLKAEGSDYSRSNVWTLIMKIGKSNVFQSVSACHPCFFFHEV